MRCKNYSEKKLTAKKIDGKNNLISKFRSVRLFRAFAFCVLERSYGRSAENRVYLIKKQAKRDERVISKSHI